MEKYNGFETEEEYIKTKKLLSSIEEGVKTYWGMRHFYDVHRTEKGITYGMGDYTIVISKNGIVIEYPQSIRDLSDCTEVENVARQFARTLLR